MEYQLTLRIGSTVARVLTDITGKLHIDGIDRDKEPGLYTTALRLGRQTLKIGEYAPRGKKAKS